MSDRREDFLPFSRPTLGEEEIAEVVDSLRSGWITTGPKVARFETQFADRLGGEAVAVSSATAGLHVVLHALGVGPGDEVVVPAITWASTANVVELLGARAVFADLDPETLQIDPADVARRMSERTKAVVPVHYAGAPADLDGLRRAAGEVPVIEDAAHALGTVYRGREVGSGSLAAVFSFHPIKNVTTGEGGMVVTRDPALAERLRLLRFHGVSKDAWRRYHRGGAAGYEVVEPGYKYNMTDLQAAIGIHQMPRLDGFNDTRRRLAERYDRLLAADAATRATVRPIGRPAYPHVHAWHLYVVRLDLDVLDVGREELLAELGEENVGTGLHFPALHLAEHYRRKYGYAAGDLPHAEAAGESIFSLPLYPTLGEADQDDVVAALARVTARHRRTAVAGAAR